MSTVIVPVVGADASAGDESRTAEIAGFLGRWKGASVANPNSASNESLLFELARFGLLFVRAGEEGRKVVSYTPSVRAATKVRLSAASTWPGAVAKRLVREIRSTTGALFRLRSETPGDDLEIFITDWSPCPAACAVAVHAQHPFASGFADQIDDVFTGRYVRHPLTGDLLPVWVAHWVKPDFGTGAVLVNPAHDVADLEFGKKIGLPIRFALAPESYDGSPSTWPEPPVIKSGKAVRTGYWDGLDHVQARAAYFKRLVENELAVAHEDVRLPSSEIGELEPSPGGAIAIDSKTGRITPAVEATSSGRYLLKGAPALAAAAAAREHTEVFLVLSAAAQKSVVIALAPLLVDTEVATAARVRILALQPTEPSKLLSHCDFAKGVLVAAKTDQPAVVRQQLLDQVERFVANHSSLHSGRATFSQLDRGTLIRQHPKIVAALENLDLPNAFRLIYALQKSIIAGESGGTEELEAYRTSARMLFGMS